jgi:hypothetical protein
MKRVIFTSYDDLKVEIDKWNVNYAADHLIREYYDRLVENKRAYAESIGVDFIFYKNEMGNMPEFTSKNQFEFTRVNLYKHYLMSNLADEYDEIMYVDMDVVFNTDENVFDAHDLEKGIHITTQTDAVESKEANEVIYAEIGMRNPTLKYHITKDLLLADGLKSGENHVINTGLIIAKAEHIKQIKFIDRLPGIINKIKEIQEEPKNKSYIKTHYYPNNESIFSYILEKNKIPFVIMSKEWNFIMNWMPDKDRTQPKDCKIIHMVGKKFNAFFEDKTQVVFSIHIDIPIDKLDQPAGPKDDEKNKSERTKERLLKYKDDLLENHKWYAKENGMEYLHFGRDEQYEEFYNKYSYLTEYNVINLYKIWLLDKLSKEYDLVLYVDFDVWMRTSDNIFHYTTPEYTLCCDMESSFEVGVMLNDPFYFHFYRHDFRNPEAKYWNAHALCSEEDIEPNDYVFNTGIIAASKRVMEQLDYFGDMDEVLAKMTELTTDSIYPESVQRSFGWDNETIMAYKVQKNDVPSRTLGVLWHCKNQYYTKEAFTYGTKDYFKAKAELDAKIQQHGSVMIHFISKCFPLAFEK